MDIAMHAPCCARRIRDSVEPCRRLVEYETYHARILGPVTLDELCPEDRIDASRVALAKLSSFESWDDPCPVRIFIPKSKHAAEATTIFLLPRVGMRIGSVYISLDADQLRDIPTFREWVCMQLSQPLRKEEPASGSFLKLQHVRDLVNDLKSRLGVDDSFLGKGFGMDP